MGLAHAPEKALSVALVIRIAQMTLALICLVVGALLAPKTATTKPAPVT